MKAMIFAAGLGTRLRPFTFDKPKALVEINGITLLEICIKNLIKFNFTDIIINVHHFADDIISFLKSKNNFNVNITISDEREMVLETGGGLLKAKSLLGSKPFLVHNVDIISNINISELYSKHLQNNSIATLAVMKRNSSRYLYFSNNNELVGWTNTKTNEEIITREISEFNKYAFCGIHIINPQLIDLFIEKGSFSIIPEYLNISKNYKIACEDFSQKEWIDVGKPENIKRAEELFPTL
jgi:NDP-sugar pyrophosphorylase family protein